jgi:hypothetical protein
MIKLQLINAYTIPTERRHVQDKSENGLCLCLLHIEEFWKMAILIFGATCNFNDQILPYSILFLAFINTDVFYLLSFKFSR